MINERYHKLFEELAHTTEITAEQVMELDKQKNDEDGLKTAETMRDDFAKLYDRLSNPDYNITRNDYLKLLVGAFIVVNVLENNKKTTELSIHGYKSDVIPKLQRIMDETSDDSEAEKLSNEIFQLNT